MSVCRCLACCCGSKPPRLNPATPGPRSFVSIHLQPNAGSTKSFRKKSDAEAWARAVESDVDKGLFLEPTTARRTTLSEVLRRYAEEILPTKKAVANERSRLKRLEAAVGAYRLSSITPSVIAKYRDERLQTVSPQTTKHELSLLRRVFEATAALLHNLLSLRYETTTGNTSG